MKTHTHRSSTCVLNLDKKVQLAHKVGGQFFLLGIAEYYTFIALKYPKHAEQNSNFSLLYNTPKLMETPIPNHQISIQLKYCGNT